jgi:hypothetical protein
MYKREAPISLKSVLSVGRDLQFFGAEKLRVVQDVTVDFVPKVTVSRGYVYRYYTHGLFKDALGRLHSVEK